MRTQTPSVHPTIATPDNTHEPAAGNRGYAGRGSHGTHDVFQDAFEALPNARFKVTFDETVENARRGQEFQIVDWTEQPNQRNAVVALGKTICPALDPCIRRSEFGRPSMGTFLVCCDGIFAWISLDVTIGIHRPVNAGAHEAVDKRGVAGVRRRYPVMTSPILRQLLAKLFPVLVRQLVPRPRPDKIRALRLWRRIIDSVAA